MITVYGPYSRNDGRKHVILYNPETQERRTVSYPKYLMEQKLGRELTDDETVDHKDDDVTNNNINNLQILSHGDNIRKSHPGPTVERITLICAWCEGSFERTQASINSYKKNHNKTGKMYCSKSCNGQDNH